MYYEQNELFIFIYQFVYLIFAAVAEFTSYFCDILSLAGSTYYNAPPNPVVFTP